MTQGTGTPLEKLVEEGFCIVDFYSTTCGPCKMLAPILARLESEFPFVNVIKINITDYPEYAEKWDVQLVPTLMFYNEGELKERHIGVLDGDALRERIANYMYD